jgi:hypothetical protein
LSCSSASFAATQKATLPPASLGPCCPCCLSLFGGGCSPLCWSQELSLLMKQHGAWDPPTANSAQNPPPQSHQGLTGSSTLGFPMAIIFLSKATS